MLIARHMQQVLRRIAVIATWQKAVEWTTARSAVTAQRGQSGIAWLGRVWRIAEVVSLHCGIKQATLQRAMLSCKLIRAQNKKAAPACRSKIINIVGNWQVGNANYRPQNNGNMALCDVRNPLKNRSARPLSTRPTDKFVCRSLFMNSVSLKNVFRIRYKMYMFNIL